MLRSAAIILVLSLCWFSPAGASLSEPSSESEVSASFISTFPRCEKVRRKSYDKNLVKEDETEKTLFFTPRPEELSEGKIKVAHSLWQAKDLAEALGAYPPVYADEIFNEGIIISVMGAFMSQGKPASYYALNNLLAKATLERLVVKLTVNPPDPLSGLVTASKLIKHRYLPNSQVTLNISSTVFDHQQGSQEGKTLAGISWDEIALLQKLSGGIPPGFTPVHTVVVRSRSESAIFRGSLQIISDFAPQDPGPHSIYSWNFFSITPNWLLQKGLFNCRGTLRKIVLRHFSHFVDGVRRES